MRTVGLLSLWRGDGGFSRAIRKVRNLTVNQAPTRVEGSIPSYGTMKNKLKIQFESGRTAGRDEVFRLVREVARNGFHSFRDCHPGCFEESFVAALCEELEKRYGRVQS